MSQTEDLICVLRSYFDMTHYSMFRCIFVSKTPSLCVEAAFAVGIYNIDNTATTRCWKGLNGWGTLIII